MTVTEAVARLRRQHGVGQTAPLYLSYGRYAGRSFSYRIGETIRPDSFDDDIRIECSNGVHFFVTRKEADEYDG